jgi:hypothetical protein
MEQAFLYVLGGIVLLAVLVIGLTRKSAGKVEEE